MNYEEPIVATPSHAEVIYGLPGSLPGGTVGLLFDGGKALALAAGCALTIYRLSLDSECPLAHEGCTYELPGEVSGLAESALGLIIVVRQGNCAILLLWHECTLLTILEIAGKITAVAGSGGYAYVVIQEDGGRGRVAQVNLRQRSISAERRLEHGNMRLAVDPAGEQVVVTDPVERNVMQLSSSLRPIAAPAPPQRGATPTPGPEPTVHEACCCCVCCKPSGHPDPAVPPGTHPGGTPPSGGPGEGTQAGPAPGPGQTGSVAIPGPHGGVVVGDGGRVDHHPPPATGRPPCGRNLFYTVADLHRLGEYILAADAKARSVSLLSADMNLLEEWQFGRTGAMLLPAAGTPMLVMHSRDTGTWTRRDVHQAVAKYRPDLELFPHIPLESKTFIGQKTYLMSHGTQTPKFINALMLPVMEGDQTFSSPNLNGFGQFMKDTVLKTMQDYYVENSFGALTDIKLGVFGYDVEPIGGPLKLPRAKIADYYFPAYDPARVELVKSGVNLSSPIVFDGRESLTIEGKPLSGGPKGGTVKLPFFALAFEREEKFFPFQVKFFGTETLTLNVTTPAGVAKALTLTFTPKTMDIPDTGAVGTKLNELASYLDGVMASAEAAAGISLRLFAAPKAFRIPQIGKQFGRLLVTFAAADLTGNRLVITGTGSSLPGGDPMGLANPILGTMTAGDTPALERYLENAALLAQEAVSDFNYNARLLKKPESHFNAGTMTLTTIMAISDRNGGPGAEVKLIASSGLEALFNNAVAKANSASTANNAKALRDRAELFGDAFSAAIQRLRDAKKPTEALKNFSCVLIMPVEPPGAGVPPWQTWNVSPLHRPFGFRGAENILTVVDATDKAVQLKSAWALIFMTGGLPDHPLICHEVGHALHFGDLYHQEGYRDELAYMDSWAMMDSHPPFAHHCGYHKLQAGWIPDGAGTEDNYERVLPIRLPDAAATITRELLLVPLELWRDSLIASARAAFGVGGDIPVVQLARIDFGGDGANFGLIEARQPGAVFSQKLPGGGGVLITNGIFWALDERFATNGWYRRPLHLLNPNNILRNPGDQFDLARAPELPVKGTKVEVVDRKLVEGDAQVYRLKVTRENAEFVDLYFSTPEFYYYKSPDLWVDWAGNNKPTAETLVPDFAVGQPSDQGEAIRVHPKNHEHHWIVARLRNRGQVKALDVKLRFFYFEPPGAGDARKPMDVKNLDRYKLVGTAIVGEVEGNDVPKKQKVRWDVPPGFKGHTCLLVQIEDYKIPQDSTGAALGSDDYWQINNQAQKNVDKFEALSGSPFTPIEFDFAVHNGGVGPEFAYPEPDGLPYGMKLTVTPPSRMIGSSETALFHCKLELDERIIRTGCENDQRFQIHAWRQDPESSARWGGVEYEIRPRENTITQLGGFWDYNNEVTLEGKVAPDPGGGTVQIRLDFQNQQARWVPVAVAGGGKFIWKGHAPANSFVLDGIAYFEGNRKFGSSRSDPVEVKHPPIIK